MVATDLFTIYSYSYLILGLGTAYVMSGYTTQGLLSEQNRKFPFAAFILCILVAALWGFRGYTQKWKILGDSGTYAYIYNTFTEIDEDTFSLTGEPLWKYIIIFCKSLGFDFNMYFFFIDLLQMVLIFAGCCRLFHNKTWIAILFFISSFGFESFLCNGIRIGLASAIFIFAISFADKKWGLIPSILIMLCGMMVHTSLAITIFAFCVSYFLIRNPNVTVGIWVICVLLSFSLGRFFEPFLLAYIENDRLEAYLTAEADPNEFRHTGFRWDFLLYSAAPLMLGYYIIHTMKRTDKFYNILFNTYVIANAFWVLVIQSNFSNRFAGLSWFLIPLVLCYPLLKLDIWKDQGRPAAYVLTFATLFTFFIYKFLNLTSGI